MGENSKIEWTDHTFNPWWGCVKVSEGCANCYAETFAKRTGHSIWGPAATTKRRTFGDKHWAEPVKWNAEAEAAGQRRRVFCASMADVFEDHPGVVAERVRLWKLIEATPWLDWLLLTKRPENVNHMVPGRWRTVGRWPVNVWVGTSVENQDAANKRIPELVKVPCPVRFLSCEPLLGPVDLDGLAYFQYSGSDWALNQWLVEWIIVGGESGPKARPIDAEWVRNLRDCCAADEVAFFFKQWGGVRKHETGRTLDGREWSEVPTVDLQDPLRV